MIPPEHAGVARRRQRRQSQRGTILTCRAAAGRHAVLSFPEWCQLNDIGERTGRRILASGNGPVITQLSDRRIGVTVRNNRIWQASRAR